jgi:ABC-2 type transport system permease protein
MQPFTVQLLDLTLIQLTNWRWSWRTTLLTSLITPILSTLALGVFAAGSGPETLGHIITGNVVLSLLFGTVGNVSSNFAYMRVVGMLDYLATLPLYRVALILASVFAFLALSLLPAILTLMIGALILEVRLVLSPWVIVVIPLISMTLCGLGALIGVMCRSIESVGSISTLTTFGLVMLGPIVIPANRLPDLIQTISLLSPATYAASALRQVVLGIPDRIPLGVDLLVLSAIMVGLLWLVSQRLDWRQNQ